MNTAQDLSALALVCITHRREVCARQILVSANKRGLEQSVEVRVHLGCDNRTHGSVLESHDKDRLRRRFSRVLLREHVRKHPRTVTSSFSDSGTSRDPG